MPNKFKKNKTFINDKNRKKILKEYFEGNNSTNLAKIYGYTVHAVNKYLDGRATKIYIDEKGTTWRKCSTCTPLTYKLESSFLINQFKDGTFWYMSYCKSCHYRMVKNKKIIANNIGDDKYLNYTRKSWAKNKVKYNFRRRFMRIIGYLDRKGKVIKKDQN